MKRNALNEDPQDFDFESSKTMYTKSIDNDSYYLDFKFLKV